jgi:hypothetical protein
MSFNTSMNLKISKRDVTGCKDNTDGFVIDAHNKSHF